MQKVLNTLDVTHDTGVTLVWEAVDGCFGKDATHILYRLKDKTQGFDKKKMHFSFSGTNWSPTAENFQYRQNSVKNSVSQATESF